MDVSKPSFNADKAGSVDHETSIPDSEAIAREAISRLAYNGLAFRWDLPGDPSDAVRSMVESCFRDGEIAAVLSDMACRYVMKQLADDHLGLGRIEIAEEAPRQDEKPPAET
jgi:hypothetical protein